MVDSTNMLHFSNKFINAINEHIQERKLNNKIMKNINLNPKRPNSRIRRRNQNGYRGIGTDSGWRKDPTRIGKREMPIIDKVMNNYYNSIIRMFRSTQCKFTLGRGYLMSKHYGSKPLSLLLRHLKDDNKSSKK